MSSDKKIPLGRERDCIVWCLFYCQLCLCDYPALTSDAKVKVIRNEDLSYYRKSSKKHEERIKSKINSKDPVLEILDEDDDYEKPIIIGVAKK